MVYSVFQIWAILFAQSWIYTENCNEHVTCYNVLGRSEWNWSCATLKMATIVACLSFWCLPLRVDFFPTHLALNTRVTTGPHLTNFNDKKNQHFNWKCEQWATNHSTNCNCAVWVVNTCVTIMATEAQCRVFLFMGVHAWIFAFQNKAVLILNVVYCWPYCGHCLWAAPTIATTALN